MPFSNQPATGSDAGFLYLDGIVMNPIPLNLDTEPANKGGKDIARPPRI
jgi:hypothetical protein